MYFNENNLCLVKSRIEGFQAEARKQSLLKSLKDELKQKWQQSQRQEFYRKQSAEVGSRFAGMM